MSYDIYIGNAELESDWPGEDGIPRAEWVVMSRAEVAAPVFPFDEMTGNGNSRHPGYSQWGDFCEATDLHQLFYGIEHPDGRRHYGGILSHHPGIVALSQGMLDEVRASRNLWEANHPGAIPGWDFTPGWSKPEADDGIRGRDSNLARLLWLEWWMDWALRTCERPAISNR